MKFLEFNLYHKDTYYNQSMLVETFKPETILINVEQVSACRVIKKQQQKNSLVELKLVGAHEYYFGEFLTPVTSISDLLDVLAGKVIAQPVVPKPAATDYPQLQRKEKQK